MKKINNKYTFIFLAIVTIFVLLFSYFYFTKNQTENFQQSDIEEMKNKIIENKAKINSSTNKNLSVLNNNYLTPIENILKKQNIVTCDSSGNCIMQQTSIDNIQKLINDAKTYINSGRISFSNTKEKQDILDLFNINGLQSIMDKLKK